MSDFMIVEAGEYIGAYCQKKHPIYSYAKREQFKDFIESIKETYPDTKFHCVKDEKLSQLISEKIRLDLQRAKDCQER
jgi:hypothetical protein